MAVQANKGVEAKKRFSLFSYIKETKQELKKVSWPTRKELLKNKRPKMGKVDDTTRKT